MQKKLAAEFLGTLWYVFAGCGAAIVAAGVQGIGIGLLGISLAFGLAYISLGYAFAPVSGSHFNPAVTLGLWASGRFPLKEVPLYLAAQLVGGIAGAALVYYVAMGVTGFSMVSGLDANGYGDHSPFRFDLYSCGIAELASTIILVIVFIGTTGRRGMGFGPLAVGLAITLINLVLIPISNAGINPARSTGTAVVSLLSGTWPLQQLWLFWVAPILGAIVAGYFMRWMGAGDMAETDVEVTVIETV